MSKELVSPEGQDFQQKLKDGGRFAGPYPSYILVWSGAPETKRRDEPSSGTKYSSCALNGNPLILSDSGEAR